MAVLGWELPAPSFREKEPGCGKEVYVAVVVDIHPRGPFVKTR